MESQRHGDTKRQRTERQRTAQRKKSDRAILSYCCSLLCGFVFVVPWLTVAAGDKKADTSKPLRPFLEEFKVPETPVVGSAVKFPSAFGALAAFVARPQTEEALPAVVLLGPDGLDEWMKLSTHELASVGYVAVALDCTKRAVPTGATPEAKAQAREQMLAESVATVRWLRSRKDVLPGQIGVVGWRGTCDVAALLAATAALQACVVCDVPPAEGASALAAWRRTPVIGLFAGADAVTRKSLVSFKQDLDRGRVASRIRVYEGTSAGFMNPASKAFSFDASELAWVEMYEFLGKHVEDAPESPALPQGGKFAEGAEATIADIMRSVNQPTGVRGKLIEELNKSPTNAKEWQAIRAEAALLLEAGRLLQHRTPPKGPPAHWLQAAKDYAAVAEEIVAAADRRDQPAAERAVTKLGQQCAMCHRFHR